MIRTLCKDPFRLLFPIAITLALYACMSWILFTFFQIGEYPTQLHARLFIGGYLYLTIIGFLLTAVPRFTQTSFATTKDIIFIGLNSMLLWISVSIDTQTLFWAIISLGWLHLVIFSCTRFIKRVQNPPFTFLFVGLGVAFGFLGSTFLLISNFIEFDSFNLELIGKSLFYDGMVMSLILGIGGRLIPGILGFKEVVSSQRNIYEQDKSFFKVIPKSMFALCAVFVLSFILEFLGVIFISYVLRSIVITYIAFKYWNIHKNPSEKKANNLALRLSCLTLVIASWLLVFLSDYRIDMKHLIYIGSYSLITFLVAARVTLAHGEEGLSLEKKHFPFTFFAGLLLFAALTRATAIFIPSSYLNHLGYTAVLYLTAVILWIFIFIPRILKPL